MYRFLICSFLLFSLQWVILGQNVTLSIRPEQPIAGMTAQLTLTSTDGNISISSLPAVKGIVWHNNISRQTQMYSINGKNTTTNSITTSFTVEKAGDYQIPSFPIRVNGKQSKTNPLTLKVTPTPETPADAGKDNNNLYFSTLTIPGMETKKEFYAGEELPLDYRVYISDRIRYSLQAAQYPSFVTGDGVSIRLKDYRQQNPRMPNFASFDRYRQQLHGKSYTVYMFRTMFRPLAPGQLTLSVKWPVSFVEDRGFFGAEVVAEHIFGGKLNPLTIKPLPALPANMPTFCGLIGAWKWQADLNAENCKTGDPITLKLQFSGSGSLETFRAPTLDLPGFRIYPPEIKKNGSNNNLVSYTMIPLRDGTLPVKIALSTFNPAAGEYEAFEFNREITVKKAESLVASPKTFVDASGTDANTPQEQETSGTRHKDVLYLHKDISQKVAIPLMNNVVMFSVMLLLCGLLFFIGSLMLMMRQKQFRDNPGLSRRHYASKQKKVLLQKLKDTPPEQLDTLSGELSSYLNDILDLPPGSGLDTAANQFNEEQTAPFAHALKTLANAAWLPGVKKEFTPELKKILIKGFSKFVVIALLLCPFTLSAAVQEEAMTAYDNGKYKQALELYASELKQDPTHISPSLLYNMGNCYYQLGDLSRAAVCYERALRLAPRNSDILVNLNLVRRKLLLDERYKLNQPADLAIVARDSLRYDEWLLVIAAALTILLAAAGLHFLEKPSGKWLIWTALPVTGLAVIAAIMQNVQLYSPEQAIVIERNAPAYTLPSEKNGNVERQLKEGQEVRIMEKRLDWVRVRLGNDEEGWVQQKYILPLWNTNMDDLIPRKK